MDFNVNKYLKDDILNEKHPSDFNIDKKANIGVLILRLPFINLEEVSVVSYSFLIDNNNKKVFFYRRDKQMFDELGKFLDLHDFLDSRIDKILSKLNSFHMDIASIEDKLYDGVIEKSFSKKWLFLKRELTLIERLLSHSLIAFERFMHFYKQDVDNFEFKDLKEHLKRALDFSKSAIERLDYIYEFFRVRQDERMNYIMFVLTLLSGIFLPLTLVTGFFGMNTTNLPFSQGENGTLKAVIIGVMMELPLLLWLYKSMNSKSR